MKFLVVDDSSTMRRILVNSLSKLGHTYFEEAVDGVDAWNKFRNSNFNVVLTDWNMPRMNGLELVKKIREVDKDTPIVMITTEGGKREVITAIKAGVNNYLIKPFTPVGLQDKLRAVLDTYE